MKRGRKGGGGKERDSETGILVENFHRRGRGQALKSTLNFLGKSPCISLGFSERDRSLKQVRTLGTLKFRPLGSRSGALTTRLHLLHDIVYLFMKKQIV
jgi:hypothetical protein